MGSTQPFFDGEALLAWFQTMLIWLQAEVFTPVNIVYTAMQIPAVIGTGFVSWWIHDFAFHLFSERIEASVLTDYAKSALLILASLILPLSWSLGLWLSIGISVYFDWPHNVIWVAINLLTAWIIIRIVCILVRDPIWARLITLVAYVVAVLNIFGVLGPVIAFLDSLAFDFGTVRVSLLTVLKGMLSFGVLLWAAVLGSRILERRIQKLPNLTPSVQVLVGKLFKVTLITFAIIVSLSSIGVDFTALAVFSGAVGVGVGFGLQKVVSNLISGIILLMDKSIKPGDIILVKDTYGWVSSLGARYVAVETRDSTEYLIPNEDIITQQVVNWSHENNLARLKVQVHLAYKADVDHALALMKQATSRCSRVLAEPAPNALLLGFGESYFVLELRFWISDVQNGIKNVSSQVLLEILRLFRENDIALPYPHHDIHVRDLPPVALFPGDKSG